MRAALLLAATLLLAGCAERAASPDASAGAGPAWSFVDTDGVTHARDAPPGNATVLFFMATWCGSCKATAPILADAHAAYAERGVRTYSLTFDPRESAEDLARWKDAYAQPWPHGVDEGLRVAKTFGITSQSSVVVLDADGRVVQAWGYGRVTAPALRGALDGALGG